MTRDHLKWFMDHYAHRKQHGNDLACEESLNGFERALQEERKTMTRDAFIVEYTLRRGSAGPYDPVAAAESLVKAAIAVADALGDRLKPNEEE